MTRHDYSFDLETLGTGRNSYILSIGCAKFDIETGDVLDTFYSKTRCGDEFKIDFKTVQFWMKQDDEVKKDLFNKEDNNEIHWVLNSLRNWLEDGCIVWGNGSTFDISLLEDAYKLCKELLGYKVEIPWHYRNIRDVRTVVDLASIGGFKKKHVEREGIHHNALDDAIYQAKLVANAYCYLATSCYHE
jgi:inhibitor of KinA sporulation pathway (predicted exonuclease)